MIEQVLQSYLYELIEALVSNLNQLHGFTFKELKECSFKPEDGLE
jgi:hypothetical protein